jgi:hypothetical protein
VWITFVTHLLEGGRGGGEMDLNRSINLSAGGVAGVMHLQCVHSLLLLQCHAKGEC